MKLRTLLIIYAGVSVAFGLTFMLVPRQTLEIYGITLSPGGVTIARLLGAALLEFAFLAWFVRNVQDTQIRRAIVLAIFLGEVIGFVVALYGQLSGVVNPLGWSTVAVYLLLAIGFGYFLFAKPGSARGTSR